MGDDPEDVLMAAIRKFCGDAAASHVAGGGELKIRIHELRPIVAEASKPTRVQEVTARGAEQFFDHAAPHWRRAMDALQAFAHADRAVAGQDVVRWFLRRTKEFYAAPPQLDIKPEVASHHHDDGRLVSFSMPDPAFSVRVTGGVAGQFSGDDKDPIHD